MTSLYDLPLVIFVFAPLLLTIVLLGSLWRLKHRGKDPNSDGPQRLLAAAVRYMPAERTEWGDAMMAELIHLRGASFRWWFALGCARAALFPPMTTTWPRYVFDAFKRLGPVCGFLSVALPPLGIPLLWLAAVAAEAFVKVEGQSTSELMPAGLIGATILASLTLILSGLPLGIVGLVRREQFWALSLAGPCLSIMIFSYLLVFLHLFAGGPNGD